jgi:acylphosphatase
MADQIVAYRIVVTGHVQGVGFRALVQSICRTNRITGWVRNRDDGAVEAELIGSKSNIDGSLERIRSARGHQIRQLIVEPAAAPITPVAEFLIR